MSKARSGQPGVPGEIDELLHRHAMTKDRYFVGGAGALYADARKASEAIGDGLGLAGSAVTQGAAEKALLLTGRAGVGKTHLLCDAARRRIEDGMPTILLLGQDFDGRSLLAQVGELSQLGAMPDDVLAVLDAASEAAGCTGLLMIDALNESERPGRWRGDVRAVAAACRRYPHVALVLSCRTEFVEEVIGGQELPRVEHFGFAEATDAAIMRFTREYGLEPPTFPALNPEFSNPLYLKLTCEALHTLGATRFRFGTAGLTTVTSAFIEAVNQRLSEAGRCNYDKWSDLAGTCVRQLAELGRGPWDRADVQAITEGLLPGREWSRSLLKGLITEGILIALHNGRIAFGYQRLGDIARASLIAEKDPDGIREWLTGLGGNAWRQRGVLGALAVIVPERHGAEIIDLGADRDGGVSDAVIDCFIESLLLRSPESVTPRAVALVEKLLAVDYRVSEVWECLVRIACVPGHLLNAEFLHGYLAAFGLADRDRTWSTWLTGATEADGGPGVRRVIDWAWPADAASRPVVPDDVAVLAVQLLGWLLTATDRRVRDRATKAIVSIGERAPAALAQALTRFQGVNDPYVTERLDRYGLRGGAQEPQRQRVGADRRRRGHAARRRLATAPPHQGLRPAGLRCSGRARLGRATAEPALRRPVAGPGPDHRGDRAARRAARLRLQLHLALPVRDGRLRPLHPAVIPQPCRLRRPTGAASRCRARDIRPGPRPGLDTRTVQGNRQQTRLAP